MRGTQPSSTAARSGALLYRRLLCSLLCLLLFFLYRPEIQARHTAFKRGSAYLERYCLLIAFTAYLEDCRRRQLSTTFEDWMAARPDLCQARNSILDNPAGQQLEHHCFQQSRRARCVLHRMMLQLLLTASTPELFRTKLRAIATLQVHLRRCQPTARPPPCAASTACRLTTRLQPLQDAPQQDQQHVPACLLHAKHPHSTGT